MSWYSLSTHLILPVALALVHYLETGDGTTGLLGLGFYWLLVGGVALVTTRQPKADPSQKDDFPMSWRKGILGVALPLLSVWMTYQETGSMRLPPLLLAAYWLALLAIHGYRQHLLNT